MKNFIIAPIHTYIGDQTCIILIDEYDKSTAKVVCGKFFPFILLIYGIAKQFAIHFAPHAFSASTNMIKIGPQSCVKNW